MRISRYVTVAALCAAWGLPAVLCAADSSQAASSSSTNSSFQQSTEIEQLKAQLQLQQRRVEDQQSQIRSLQLALEDQQTALEEQKRLIDKITTLEAALAPPPEPEHKVTNLGAVASTVPYIPKGVAPILPPIAAAAQIFPLPGTLGDQIPDSPLQLRI